MVRRRGELSTSTIDRDWPYQVALPQDQVIGKNHQIHHAFCKGMNLSLCSRGHSFSRDDRNYHVYCFATELDADTFRTYFGGEPMAPKDRPRTFAQLGNTWLRAWEHDVNAVKC